MIQFRIYGKLIQLKSGTEISLSFKNSDFGFDSIELNRTQTFDIPATPENNLILGFANKPEFSGGYMRKILQCDMFYSGGVVSGNLSILSYENGNYKASFLYGELLGLKKVKEAGKLSEIFTFTDALIVNSAVEEIISPVSPLEYDFKFYRYISDVPNELRNVDYLNFLPSVKLKYLIDGASSNLGISVDFGMGSNIDDLLIKLSKTNIDDTPAQIAVTGNAKNGYAFTTNNFVSQVRNRKYTYFVAGVKKTEILVNEFKALKDFNMKVPASSYLTIVSTTSKTLNTSENQFPLFENISNEQVIQIKKDDQFAILNKYNYIESRGLWFTPFDVNIGTFVFSAYTGELGTIEIGDEYQLQPNLPDVTLIDLIKTFAFLNSKAIRWNEHTKTISFSDFSYIGNGIDLTPKIISIDNLKRSVGDYCQENSISFNSDKSVLDSNKLKITYFVENENLTSEKDLFKIPFSEGNNEVISRHRFAVFNDFVLNDSGIYENKSERECIGNASSLSASGNMHSISKGITVNNSFKSILEISTTIQVTAKMYLFEFNNLTNDTVFRVKNKRYCVFSGQWSRNIAKLELILLPD